MRRILLWMASNRWLRERLPRLPFTRRAVRRFMPGEDAGSALDAGASFQADGITSMYTRLGEGDEVAVHYTELLDDIRRRGLDGEVSVKLTQLGFDLDIGRAEDHV